MQSPEAQPSMFLFPIGNESITKIRQILNLPADSHESLFTYEECFIGTENTLLPLYPVDNLTYDRIFQNNTRLSFIAFSQDPKEKVKRFFYSPEKIKIHPENLRKLEQFAVHLVEKLKNVA